MEKEKLHNPTKRVLDILTILGTEKKEATLSDLSTITGIPKGTLSPILQTMFYEKYINYDSITKLYSIGPSSYIVGNSFVDNINDFDFIVSEMEFIVKGCNETCQLAILDDFESLYIGKVDSSQQVRLVSEIGKKLPSYATAVGKALLSNKSRIELNKSLEQPFSKYTENTISSVDELFQEISESKHDGFYYDHGEIIESIDCIAVPINLNDIPKYAISVSIPSYRFNEEIIENVKMLLKQSKQRIETFIVK